MIEVELVNRFDSKDYQLIWPGNIIYLAYEKDMSYDRASEDMGCFFDAGELLAKGANAFIDRNRARNIKIESDSLFYLDKYKVSLKN